jgi:16S rRNA processing protein RimM
VSDPDAAARLRAGTVARAHGLDGSFHVGAVVPTVFALLEVGCEVAIGGQTRRVTRLAGHDGRPIMGLEGCVSRAGADALRGEDLTVDRSLAGALEAEEWWAEDLEGCAVRDGAREVGTVVALLALPSCEVLEVRRVDAADGAAALLVPLIRDAVREVDIAARMIDVDLAFLGEA